MSDLIDRKQISARIADQSYLWEDDYDIDQVLEDIQNAPAVEAIPVEWIRKYTKENRLYQSDDFYFYINDMIVDWAERKEEWTTEV